MRNSSDHPPSVVASMSLSLTRGHVVRHLGRLDERSDAAVHRDNFAMGGADVPGYLNYRAGDASTSSARCHSGVEGLDVLQRGLNIPGSFGKRERLSGLGRKDGELRVFGLDALPGGVQMSVAEPGKHSVAAFINSLIKQHTRVVPLGFSGPTPARGRASGESGVKLVSNNEEGAEGVPRGRPRTVLILMSDTGGGHRASAEAIKTAFEIEYGDQYKVHVIDLWKDHTPWPFNQMPNSYSFLVKHETLWKVAYYATAPRFVHQPQMAATSALVAREVAKGLVKYQPDVIVSVHPLMQHVPLRVLRSRGLLGRIPFTTVITDLNTCHPTWFHKQVSLCFCPTKEVAQRAIQAGLQPTQLRVHGLPIRPSFCRPTRPKMELRAELGMDLELPTVILMGGGEGMGPVEATARALGRSLAARNGGRPAGQLVVICGRNKKLTDTLMSIKWDIPVVIKGFVTNMPEWMAASDCVITKAGPGTIAEAMIKGLPMILSDYIAGQEAGNVPFVVDNKAGKFSENPVEIARMVADWFGPKGDELQTMAKNAARLGKADAVFKIVRDLDMLAKEKDRVQLGQGNLAFT